MNALSFMRATILSQSKLINRGVTCILFGSLKNVILLPCSGLIVKV